jgi:hypothetical protein
MKTESSPPPPAATDGAGPQSAAAQDTTGELTSEKSGTETNPTASPAPAAATTDAEIVADIEKRVKRKDWDSAYDLLRGIQDRDLHSKTASRIDKAFAFVAAKAAAK